MIIQFVNDKHTFEEVKAYIQNYFESYCIDRIRENKDTEGLHHAMISIDNAFQRMQSEFLVKGNKIKQDHTL